MFPSCESAGVINLAHNAKVNNEKKSNYYDRIIDISPGKHAQQRNKIGESDYGTGKIVNTPRGVDVVLTPLGCVFHQYPFYDDICLNNNMEFILIVYQANEQSARESDIYINVKHAPGGVYSLFSAKIRIGVLQFYCHRYDNFTIKISPRGYVTSDNFDETYVRGTSNIVDFYRMESRTPVC